MDFWYEVYLLTLVLLLLVYVSLPERFLMASAADLQKLIDNIKSANAAVARAAADAPRHAVIIDNLNQRLTVNDQNMNKLDEFEKQMAAMDTIGNGGPVLDATFSGSPTSLSTAEIDLTSHSTKGVGKIGS